MKVAVPTLGKLVVKWRSNVGLEGEHSSDSLWKTWAYHQRKTRGVGLEMLQEVFGQSSGRITLN